jgi:hypothetical protein
MVPSVLLLVAYAALLWMEHEDFRRHPNTRGS